PLASHEVHGAEEEVQYRVANEGDGPHVRRHGRAGRTLRFRDRFLAGATGIDDASVDLGLLVEDALLVQQVDDLLGLLHRSTDLGERAERTACHHAAELARDEHRKQRPGHGSGLYEEPAYAGVVAQPPGRGGEEVALEAEPLLGEDRLDRPSLVGGPASLQETQ